MRWLLRRCPQCLIYTLKDKCPVCGRETFCAHPHRYSLTDRYVRYRILLKHTSREG